MHWVDHDFLPDIGGAVERFIVNRHGQVDGLILSCSRSTGTPDSLVSSIAPMRHRGSSRSRWLVALSVLLVGLVVAIAIAAALAPTLLPSGDRMGGEGRSIAAGVIFVGSYLALAIGRIPGLSIDRAGIALVGAGLMVASGALPLDDAYKAVDLDTITLLLGMMIVVANLRLSGFFAVANAWVMAHARRPLILLGALVATTGVLSAFLVNDAICLVFAPLVLEFTLALKRRPMPYLLAVAMASNVGSTATITGNPQNIMIGSFSHIPYTTFALALGPVALIGLPWRSSRSSIAPNSAAPRDWKRRRRRSMPIACWWSARYWPP
jgi:di/tricarboxylate transporter